MRPGTTGNAQPSRRLFALRGCGALFHRPTSGGHLGEEGSLSPWSWRHSGASPATPPVRPWTQPQTLSVPGHSWAVSLASQPHPWPPFSGGASDTPVDRPPLLPGATGSGPLSGVCRSGGGSPPAALPVMVAVLPRTVDRDPIGCREPDSGTAPATSSGHEVATLISQRSLLCPRGLPGNMVIWR